WQEMYLWLLAALVVDGIDGPLARLYHVKKYAPHWDGALLDLIVDYLTYVFIPAYALAVSGLLGEWEGWFAAIAITLTGVVYFADTRMKTPDKSFSGFPGCWNMVILAIFALAPPQAVTLIIIIGLAIAQFIPLKFVHPLRTIRWRYLSLPMMFLWTFSAFWVGFAAFDPPTLAQALLIISSVYLLGAGIVQQVIPAR
ncbi:MAG TPA: phosphatidylcholine synthase, partial [Paracoccaceae bacterium]|nr:phosphatidylcholine synthase [Paracoccaceae bacterium]